MTPRAMLDDAPVDRRRLLQLAGAGAAALWLPRGAWSQPRFRTDPFGLGVASGSPTADSVVLWTRLWFPGAAGLGTGGAQATPVRWEVAHDERFSRIARSGQALALPELAHSVHAEVDGLAPDRWYFYRFMAGDAVSPVGRTRTFPAPEALAQRLRLGYASCQRWEHGYFSAWRHMRAEDLDLVLFLGDYIYEYPTATRAVRKPTGGWVLSLEDYRRRYALYRAEPELQAMHAACPWLVTWDDHEVQNDYAGVQAGNSGTPVADFAGRRAAAYQAFYEHMPLRTAALGRALAGASGAGESRIYSHQRFGRLAGLHLLDTRQYRDPQVCSPPGQLGSGYLDPKECAAWHDPRRTLLGAAQEGWLDGTLGPGREGWSVIGQSTLFGQRDARPGPDRFVWNDSWDGYPAARERLTAALQKNGVANPVVFGGDVHENWVGQLKADYGRPGSPSLGAEFCGTSITSRSSGNAKLPARLAENPHFVFADSERKGYGVAEFTPQRLSVSLRVVGNVEERDTGIETLARFTVQAGARRVERD